MGEERRAAWEEDADQRPGYRFEERVAKRSCQLIYAKCTEIGLSPSSALSSEEDPAEITKSFLQNSGDKYVEVMAIYEEALAEARGEVADELLRQPSQSDPWASPGSDPWSKGQTVPAAAVFSVLSSQQGPWGEEDGREQESRPDAEVPSQWTWSSWKGAGAGRSQEDWQGSFSHDPWWTKAWQQQPSWGREAVSALGSTS